MTEDNYLDSFLDTDDLQQAEKEKLPSWVTDANSSMRAYKAIMSLKETKRQYIKKHGNKSAYGAGKKKYYQISKTEVANAVGKKSQPLFNTTKYADELKTFFDEINNLLIIEKDKKLAKPTGGKKGKTKEELIKELNAAETASHDILTATVDELFQKTLDSIPLDVKRKLKLI